MPFLLHSVTSLHRERQKTSLQQQHPEQKRLEAQTRSLQEVLLDILQKEQVKLTKQGGEKMERRDCRKRRPTYDICMFLDIQGILCKSATGKKSVNLIHGENIILQAYDYIHGSELLVANKYLVSMSIAMLHNMTSSIRNTLNRCQVQKR